MHFMKKCNACTQIKSLESFHKRGRGYQSVCKVCRKEIDSGIYQNNPQKRLSYNVARYRETMEWMRTLKSKPCTDCGHIFNSVAMQWDHIASDKTINIADAIKKGWSKKRILIEVGKCELVCANCHAVRTWNRKNLK